MNTMTHWERIRAAIKGEEVDRVPIAFWRHWPPDDESPECLAGVALRWQKTYDWDMVKITPDGTYGIKDWGGKSVYNSNDTGTYSVVKEAVTSSDQWPKLQQLDVRKGWLGRQIKSVELIAKEVNKSAPVLQTVFSPLTTARKMAGDRVFAHMRQDPEAFKQGLEIITEAHTKFMLECIKAGADGLYFAAQCDSYRLMTEAEYKEFGEKYDCMLLNAVRPNAEIIMLHAHGLDIMFDLVANYPVDAINWHDQITPPTLEDGMKRFKGMISGGVNEWKTLLRGNAEEIESEIKDAIWIADGRRFMVGTGCVVPINTPPSNIRIARDAVEKKA